MYQYCSSIVNSYTTIIQDDDNRRKRGSGNQGTPLVLSMQIFYKTKTPLNGCLLNIKNKILFLKKSQQ